MTQETITRIKLTAAEGMTLTNGETFGKEVYLGIDDAPENWREITDTEATAIQEAAKNDILGDDYNGEQSVTEGN